MRTTRFYITTLLYSILMISTAMSDDEDCFMCHSDPDLTTERAGREISLYVEEDALGGSVHQELECISCHMDADVEEFPHPERLNPVYCGTCHDEAQEDFDRGIHGMALMKNQPYAPTCIECHGKHNILSPGNPESRSYKMNIPFLCGKCHREGAPVARVYKITERNIIENYSQSIHGEGLFKKGLTVTATCTDCHGSHFVLPHTYPESTTSPQNIAETCMQCHSRIEDVHIRIIEGERWQKDPGSIPACTDCHLPHKARKESIALILSDQACQRCHADPDVHKVVDGERVSLFVDKEKLLGSSHSDVTCVKCHTDVNPRHHRPCVTVTEVNCSSCHTGPGQEYKISGHAEAFAEGNPEAPECVTCHGYHDTKSKFNEESRTYRAAIPTLCGECHSEDKEVILTESGPLETALMDYSQSVHGKSLQERGLLPSAVCSDCHTAHMILDHEDERSSVHPRNVPATCSTCHRGIYTDYIQSVHYSVDERREEKLPTCADCHSSHKITAVQKDEFMLEVTEQCGSCHEELSETYLMTMHGKAYQLGYLESAKCSDCHNAHLVLSHNNPNSSVGLHNIVNTCQKCHEDANQRFTGYLTHATHHDQEKYPVLYYTYWTMTVLLLSVFSFFGIHTLLWLPRSFKHIRERKHREEIHKTRYYIRRFELSHRITHLFVILSFMSLALTGMMLKFSGMPWAGFIADLVGGVKVAGVIHRIAAVITFGYFFFHIVLLIRKKRKEHTSMKDFIFGPDAMMFNKKDIKDFWGTLKWFVGKGPRPDYGRWTYWEKFDYFAVFWGVAVIGISGLMLWFPEFFTTFLPGWLINVATIIHSDEALLAVGFIFTIHFFNTHLRPEAFPMDKVIFTGLVPLEEYKKDRPEEYAKLKKSGALRKKVVKEGISERWEKVIFIVGFLFLGIGLLLIVLILYSILFGYQI